MSKITFYKTLDDAVKKCPSSVDCDVVGIKSQAKQDCENPLAIWRDLVRTELDLIAEGEVKVTDKQKKAIENYYANLVASC